VNQTAGSKPVEFRCLEPNCGLAVHYERKTQPGAAKKRKREPGKSFAVFLTCPNGHVHRYNVPGSDLPPKE
jgi:hypothetical protein